MQLSHPLLVETPHRLLQGYPVVVALTVEWGDQDCFQHVNNTVYLKWCETARVVYLELAGMWPLIQQEGKGPILAALHCDYRLPVTFPDSVQVGAKVTRIGNSSFRMEHAVVSLRQDALVAESDSVLVFVEYAKNQPLPVPDSIRSAFAQIEGRPLADLTGNG